MCPYRVPDAILQLRRRLRNRWKGGGHELTVSLSSRIIMTWGWGCASHRPDELGVGLGHDVHHDRALGDLGHDLAEGRRDLDPAQALRRAVTRVTPVQ